MEEEEGRMRRREEGKNGLGRTGWKGETNGK